jgi:hypothetical protein
MNVEELIGALAGIPGHYTVKAFHEGCEIEDIEAHINFVECRPNTKSVDLVIEFPHKKPQ